MSDRPFVTAVDLQGTGAHPHAWRRDDSRAEELFTARFWIDAVQSAERAGIALAFLGDSLATRTLDAVAIAARVAPATGRIGLIPTVTVTHTEPFHVSKQIASVDFASNGRAGWQVDVSPGPEQAALFGRKSEQDESSLWHEADEAIEVVTRLWDSWEDDAEIRDAATGRFIDREKLHYIDFEGDNFSVKGPSITPRSPQGRPPIAVRAESDRSLAVAVARADIVRIAAPTIDEAAVLAARIRRAVVAAGRDPAHVTVLLDVEILLSDRATTELDELNDWAGAVRAPASLSYVGEPDGLAAVLTAAAAAGLDAVTLVPLALPSGLSSLPIGQRAQGPTLREQLGLSRPASRYAAQIRSDR